MGRKRFRKAAEDVENGENQTFPAAKLIVVFQRFVGKRGRSEDSDDEPEEDVDDHTSDHAYFISSGWYFPSSWIRLEAPGARSRRE